MEFLIDGQISSFWPVQHGGKFLTLIMQHIVRKKNDDIAVQYEDG